MTALFHVLPMGLRLRLRHPVIMLGALTGLLLSLGANTAIYAVQPAPAPRAMAGTIQFLMTSELVQVTLLSLCAILSLGLATMGIYGVLSYSLTQGTQELCCRLVAGAKAGEVRGLVLRQGMKLAACGTVLGLGTALILTQWLGTLLFGTQVVQPLPFAGVALLLGLVAFVSCYVPAQRTTQATAPSVRSRSR